ncbi:MAG TPA: DUF4157 domain-containing protein [Chthoniobacterales bacterium]
MPSLQRKCRCGGTAGPTGECAACRKKRLQHKIDNREPNKSLVPPIVHEVLRSPGQPLDAQTRAFMEARFGHDLRNVRVHTDARAAESARAVKAFAYTVGRDIVFACPQYRLNAAEGKKLLAHELVHVIQQGKPATGNVPSGLEMGSSNDLLEDQANRVAESKEFRRSAVVRANSAQILQRAPDRGEEQSGSTLPFHEATELSECIRIMGEQNAVYCRQEVLGEVPSPLPAPIVPSTAAACFAPLCAQIARPPVPANDAAANSRGNEMVGGATSCLQSTAAGSKASHAADIIANETKELRAEVDQTYRNLTSGRRGARAYRYYLAGLRDVCQRKSREIGLEFQYNVIFENEPGQLQWGYGNADWDSVEGALAALPQEATKTNPVLLHFRRSECHPQDVDPKTGQCAGQGTGLVRSFTGGETTDAAKGEITIYNAGLGPAPFGRSRRLGLSATAQTIRHEVGHVLEPQIPRAQLDDLFENIMHWHQYPWAWIKANPAPYPNWAAERTRLRKETGFDDAQLDTWLAAFTPGTSVVIGDRTYFQDQSGNYLNVYETAQMPSGVEFEYARTNQGEYFAELYALAVSQPEFLSNALPKLQSAWLKRVVFHTPEDMTELAKQAALAEPARTEFIVRGSRLFTQDQLDALLNELLTRMRQPGTNLA